MLQKIAYTLSVLLISITSPAQKNNTGGDSVTVAASSKYSDPTPLQRLFMGTNYRKEWATPVTLPVFRLSNSGLTIKELGGGQQTKSLQLTDREGREWALRSVDKDVRGALPKKLRNTVAYELVQDMVSTAHPYAPLTVAALAKGAGIIAANPVFYYVAPDKAFGEHEHLFAHTVCMLEEREPTPDKSDTKSTETFLDKRLEENDHLSLQEAVLRARLLDMLIADWDRHADQWRWGIRDSAHAKYYYAIPRDRDQAFFFSTGILVPIARYLALPHFQGFTAESNDLRKLSYKSRMFDKIFINELEWKEWDRIIRSFQASLTDDVIDRAVKRMPPSIYAIRGPVIASKLKSRRDGLHRNGYRYYQFITHHVRVPGSEEDEYFRVSQKEGRLTVSAYNKKGGPERKFYERSFDPKETASITIMGLGGDDTFVIDKEVSSSIKLKLFGQKGKDTYQLEGNVRHTVHDEEKDNNTIQKNRKTKLRLR